MQSNDSERTEITTLAGGCFWCTEAIFKRLKGVKSVIPGYSGGTLENPSYDEVCTGATGHTESVQIEFDPKIISFGKILDIFWHTHNPTTLNRQGNDVGTQYRSAIFYHDLKQKALQRNQKKSLRNTAFTKTLSLQELPLLKILMLLRIITKITMRNIKMLHTVTSLSIPKCKNYF